MASTEETSYGKIEKLNADNYHTWKFNLKMILKMKNLWDIVTGTETVAVGATPTKRLEFKKRDDQAHSIICLSVKESLQIYVRNTDTGQEAWKNLAEHFEEKTLAKKIHFRRKLYSTRLQSGSSMVEHVNALRTIGEHLESLEDPVADKDMVMILLSSLPSEFNNLITTLETLKEEKLTWTYVRESDQ